MNNIESINKNISEQSNTKLSPPWVEYIQKLTCLFGSDPEIEFDFDEENYTVKMYVNNNVKAEALIQLLNPDIEFGNVTLHVQVIPNNEDEVSEVQLFRRAFDGNPVLSYVKTVGDKSLGFRNYAVFKKEVVQYWADNLQDIYGNKSTLYENIARDVLNCSDMFYSTDVKENNVYGK